MSFLSLRPGFRSVLFRRHTALGAAAGFTRWRINFTQKANAFGWLALREIELRETASGPDSATGGTASASSVNGGNVAANAFDDNTGSVWQIAGTDLGWIEYSFAEAKQILEISITASAAQDAPLAGIVEYWDGEAWIEAWNWSVATWASDETKVFTKP